MVGSILKRAIKGGVGCLPLKVQAYLGDALEVVERERTARILLKLREASPSLSVVDSDQIGDLCGPAKYSSVCHILGSGWSLLSSLHKIKPGLDLVLGFNFSALAWPEPDLHFVEIASDKAGQFSIFSEAQNLLVEKVGLLQERRVVFKNTWEKKNAIGPMVYSYGKDAFFLRDYPVRCFSRDALSHVVEKILSPCQGYVRQYSSTSLTLVGVAHQLGSKRIVLHGIDFAGPHFYDLPEFACPTSLRDIVKMIRKPMVDMNLRHLTAVGGLGQQAVIPILRERLARMDVELLAGSADSPLSELLPVYPGQRV